MFFNQFRVFLGMAGAENLCGGRGVVFSYCYLLCVRTGSSLWWTWMMIGDDIISKHGQKWSKTRIFLDGGS